MKLALVMRKPFGTWLFVGLYLSPTLALAADKVVVLPFGSAAGSHSPPAAEDLDRARAETRQAVAKVQRLLATPGEELTAQMAVKDGVADTTDEYRAAGRASTADWTARGSIDTRGGSYRIELEVCQVDTGRVESLARDLDRAHAADEIAEMLSLLLRPEGIANAEIPWQKGAPKHLPGAAAATTDVLTVAPDTKPSGPVARAIYAENVPIAIGLSSRLTSPVKRPDNAQGDATAWWVGASGGYAIAQVPGLELRGDLSAAAVGPQAIAADLGARYMIPVVHKWRLFIGPEIAGGGFFTMGGEKTARFLGRGAALAAVGFGAVQVELGGEAMLGLGGRSSIVLASGVIRGMYRF